MIEKVKVTNHLGESITLELRFPEKSGFLIQGGIDGLNPSKANIHRTELATADGSMYTSARVNSRNIVFDLGFLPNPTIERTRLLSYKYFPIKRRIEIEITTSNRVCKTYGYVESNEINIFSKTEGSIISVICPDSYFYSVDDVITSFGTIVSNFEFPFSNESLTEKLIEMSTISPVSNGTIHYEGDAPVGMIFNIRTFGTVTNFRISNTMTGELMTIDDAKLEDITGYGIIADDEYTISTVKGNKYAVLKRDGVFYNILNALEKDSDWFVLERGDNVISYDADTGINDLFFTVQNKVAYEGV